MRLHELKNVTTKKRYRKRVGRGEGSGHGKTSTKGGKGQTARSGGSIRPGFEGGQMPLYRKLPHRGFNNARHRIAYATVNVGDLSRLAADQSAVTVEILKEAGLVRRSAGLVKLLARGKVERAFTVTVDKCSEAAAELIKAAGGTVTVPAES